MTDYVSDILIKIKNANWSGKPSVSFPASAFGLAIAETLAKNGFVGAVSKKGKKARTIEVVLIYEDEKPKISGVKRMSKLSRRLYRGWRDIFPVRNGYGKLIISTPKGIMTGDEARKEKVGGEPLFEIW